MGLLELCSYSYVWQNSWCPCYVWQNSSMIRKFKKRVFFFFFFFKIITFCICYSFPSESEWNICQLWKLYMIMCLRTSSKLCFIFLVASIKVVYKAIEGRSAVFSHPWGNSWTFGNGIIDKEIFGCLLVLEEMNGAFAWVVMIVTFRPWFAKALDMSSKGMVWPWAIKENITAWSTGDCEFLGYWNLIFVNCESGNWRMYFLRR